MFRNLDELKVEFVISVYETITRQIQHTDIKTSILISWDGVMAVMLGRQIVSAASVGRLGVWAMGLAGLVGVALVLSGISIYQILRPRSTSMAEDSGAAAPGLLYSGDILRLGKTPSDRMGSYLQTLVSMEDPSQIYSHYVKSIVLIAEISLGKNRRFVRGLLFSTVGFCLLAVLVSITGIQMGAR
jgi:hypothetical protein